MIACNSIFTLFLDSWFENILFKTNHSYDIDIYVKSGKYLNSLLKNNKNIIFNIFSLSHTNLVARKVEIEYLLELNLFRSDEMSEFSEKNSVLHVLFNLSGAGKGFIDACLDPTVISKHRRLITWDKSYNTKEKSIWKLKMLFYQHVQLFVTLKDGNNNLYNLFITSIYK